MLRETIKISVHGEEFDPKTVASEVSRGFFDFGLVYKSTLWVLLTIFLGGVVAFVVKSLDGGIQHNERYNWGYFSAISAFVLMAAGSAPLVATALRLTKNHWRRPFSRIAELYAIVGILVVFLYIPLLMMLPPIEGRKTIWFTDQFPGVPVWWDFLGILFLAINGIALLIVSGIPDLAQAVSQSNGRKSAFLKPLVRWWKGSQQQWNIHRLSLISLGATYFLLLIIVQSLINVDFVMSLVPGWKDAIMPAHISLTGIQTGIGLVVLTAFLTKTFGNQETKKYFPMESFWSISKIMLALSLLWFYFWFAAMMTLWYGRMPVEQTILKTFMAEAYRWPFLLNIFFSFLLPFLLLIWNPVRKSILGPTFVAVSVLIGAFFMTVRLYVPAFGLKDVVGHELLFVPEAIGPDFLDIVMIFGVLSGVILLYMLAAKMFPMISIWEFKEGLLYQRVRPFMRGTFLVVGRPE